MRIKNGLRGKGRIGIWDDFVWPGVTGVLQALADI
jgi:hypothetical protein